MKKWLLVFITSLLISSCAADPWADIYGLGIRVINYGEKGIYYISIRDPEKQTNRGGGASFNPYSGGNGVICCFSVPKVWRPDLKAEVVIRFSLEPDETRQIVPIPYYGGDKIGDLYAIVHPDRTAELLVSMVSPDDPEWKGKIKDYPVPSLAYRKKLWAIEVKEARDSINDSQSIINNDKYEPDLKNSARKSVEFFSKRLEFLEKNKP